MEGWAFIAETSLFYGAAFGFIAYQLWSLRRDRLAREALEKQQPQKEAEQSKTG